MGIDYRDLFRPGGGASGLTWRVLLQIVDLNLSRTSSRFWSTVLDRDPITDDQGLLADLYFALTEKPHPIRTRREDAEKRRKSAEKRARIARREKRRGKKNI